LKPESYRALLLAEIEKRAKKNRNYSKRAFARDIGLSPGYLLQVLSGQKNLSEGKACQIAERLHWSQRQTLWLLNLIRLDSAKNESHKAALRKMLPKSRVQSYRDVSLETFKVMANWHYSAILILTELDDFQYDIAWIAKRLKLPVATVSEAITRLKNLGLVREEEGTLIPQFEMLRVVSVPSDAIREHHRQFLKKAAESLESQNGEARDITGSTIAINPERLPEAKKLIKQFREDLAALLDDGQVRSQVYRLSVQLFRVDG